MTRRAALSACLSMLAFLLPLSATAQIYLPGAGADLAITSEPLYPGPNQSVTLSLKSALLDLANADITWTVNGKTVLQGTGERQVTITTGRNGSSMSVVAHATSEGQSVSAMQAITPESVDLLFDAASYVPPFYRGRSLPSPNTPLRLQAIAHIATPAGEVAVSKLVYTWKQDGSVLGSLSGRGKATAILPAPPLFGESTVEVDVTTADGAYGASASARVAAIDPGITLYQDHPLFGIEFYDALPSHGSVRDVEMTFAAVPYFVSAANPDDPHLSYAWRVNGTPLAPASSSASEITVNAVGVSGPADLSLTLTSPYDLYLDAQQSWSVNFAQASTFGAPLRTPAAPADAFHGTP